MTTLLILVLVGLLILLVVRSATGLTSAAQDEASAVRVRGALAADWSEVLDRSDVLILDTETTGLGNRSELVEIALIDTRGETRFDEPVLPIGRIPREASDVHGLTRARLKEMTARPWPEVEREMAPVMRTARTVLIWNAEYDLRLIEQTVRKHEERGTAPNPPAGDEHRLTGRCVMKEYASLYGRPRIGLDEAARIEGVATVEPRHRALGDVRTVLAIVRSVVRSADELPRGWIHAMPAARVAAGGGWREDPATEKQVSYALSLLEESDREDEYDIEDLQAMSKGEVSDLIEELKEDLGS